jgi:hypothetical protein
VKPKQNGGVFMKRFKTMVLCVLISVPLFIASLAAQEKAAVNYQKGYMVDENGDLIQWMRWAGRAPKDYVPETASEKDAPKALVKLPITVAGYNWAYGCTATATAMQVAYYDRYGAPNVYTGPENGGVAPLTNSNWNLQSSQSDTDMNAIAASKMGVDGRATRGHGDDYWIAYDESEGNDPYFGNWVEHDHYAGQTCTADMMGTNQWNNWGNIDGSTSIFNYLAPSGRKLYDKGDQSNGDGTFSRDGCHGMRLFYEARGLEVQENFNQLIDGYDDPDDNPDEGPVVGGYTFADYKRNIDQGRPVLLHVVGHSMLGYGYDEAYSPPRVYCRNTWSTATTDAVYFSWGGIYSNMQHYSMSDITLHPKEYYSVPQDVMALNNNRTVTVTWWDSSVGGTRPVSYQVFRDGAQIATVATNSYQETLASSFDGVHYYKVKAVYTAPDPDITTGFSDEAGVYVCASVTSFSDTFEDGQNGWTSSVQGQWLFNPATTWWGRDTQYKYAGTYSLSDSPGANYKPDSDQLVTGGAIAEVAPGLNFSTAADANAKFWLRYLIEESFDYLHFQSTLDGMNWITMKTWSSEASTAWAYETISLGHYAGESNVRFRFILVTDPGYEAAGSNIDNFELTPSATDTSFPYVYYTKDSDLYTEYTDGFLIETKISDYSGVASARVYYKVNGGAESFQNFDSEAGDIYTWKLPMQQPGDLVEFRFQVSDTASPSNSGSKGPFFYRDGLHQKYDYSTVSFYSEVVTTTAQYDQKSYAVRFSSFHDDIVGVVVRGYDDASQPDDNENMLINVWADNNGLPGATLITPVSFNNPATLQETNKWGYVNLSAYTALDDMVGDYFIGFECGNILGTASTVTRTTMTDTGTAGQFCFDRAYSQYYAVAGGSLTWELQPATNYHIRCVTTDKQISPPIIVAPAPVAVSVAPSSTSSQIVNVGNDGDYPLNYNASITFDGFAAPGANVHTNNFQSGLVYTNSGAGNWATGTGGTWNASTTCAVSAANSTSVMTSAAFNTATTPAGTSITLDFDYTFTLRTGASGTVAYWTGSAWTNVWTVNATGNGHVQVSLPIKATNTQLRFTGVMTKAAGQNSDFRVDNIVVAHSSVPYTWLTLDGGATTTGTVAAQGTDPLTYGFNTAGLTTGNTYNATVNFSDADGFVQSKSTTVALTVTNNPPPAVPTLLTPTDASTTTDLTPTFDWNDVSGATSYTIQVDNNSDFSSPEIQQSPTVSTYTPASNLAAGTYYWRVLATNANGSSAYSASWSVILNATVVPGVPANLVTSVVSGNIFINWDDAANATNYDVYSSANPYGTFAFLANVAVSEYTYVPGANTKMFFYIVSKNATKTETPDNIEVKAIKKRTIKEIKEGTSGN